MSCVMKWRKIQCNRLDAKGHQYMCYFHMPVASEVAGRDVGVRVIKLI